MLDIRYIIDNSDAIRDIIKKRHVQADLDGVLSLYAQRKPRRQNNPHRSCF